MNYDSLGNHLDLIENSTIMLIIGHKENAAILKGYLDQKYQVNITSSLSKEHVFSDMIIIDEYGFKENRDILINIKKSNTSMYLPVVLITHTPVKKISGKYLKIIDEIVFTPVRKEILLSRIENLLNVRKLFLSTHIYQKLTEKNPVGICILHNENIIRYVNKSLLKIMEETRDEILGRSIFDFLPREKIQKHLKSNIKEQENLPALKLKNNEREKWVDIRFSPIEYENINFRLLIIVDITKQKQSEEKIKYLTFHDQLTGLYNRDYFMEELKRLNTRRQLPLTLIMGDINNLKLVNDAFGHARGDCLIKKIGKFLKNNLRDEDILARIGGDEFSILLPQTERGTGNMIKNRITEACSKSQLDLLETSIALGVATKNKSSEDINEIMKKADDRMYQNKMSESKEIKSNIISNLETRLKEKSNESDGHIGKMKKMALRMAAKLNLNEKQKNKLSLLSRLHDIGKVSIAEDILKKPDKLSTKEFENVKNHSECGYRIVKSIPNLASVAEEVLSHHEWWDGSGYPRGLKKDEIPLLARIISIVDAYEVMRAGRPYQKPKSKQESLEEIKKYTGTQFDPELVDKFMQTIKDNS